MKKHIIIFLVLLVTIFVGCTNQSVTSHDSSTVSNQSLDNSVTEVSEQSHSEQSTVQVDKETPGVPLEGTFGEYTFVDGQDEKRTAVIYSYEQITDIKTRRENGEQFYLSAEELELIVSDTFKMFEKYDLIRIRDLEGNINTYYGSSFYTSDEYYDCFNSTAPIYSDASFDYKMDVMNAIYDRISVLNSVIFESSEGEPIVFSDISTFTTNEINDLVTIYNKFMKDALGDADKTLLSKYNLSLYYFDFGDRHLNYCANISTLSSATASDLLYDSKFPQWIGETKYDNFENNIVIELWEEDTKRLISRIRIDEVNQPNEFVECCKQIKNIKTSQNPNAIENDRVVDQIEKYRAVVYVNGVDVFSTNSMNAFVYSPDGDINVFAYYSKDAYTESVMFQQGIGSLTAYINDIMEKYLDIKFES